MNNTATMFTRLLAEGTEIDRNLQQKVELGGMQELPHID